MNDELGTKTEMELEAKIENQSVERTPVPLRAKICIAVGGFVFLCGVLVGFGVHDWYFSLWAAHPGWSSLLTATILVCTGLCFERTRDKAMTISLVGFLLFVLFWMAVFSGYGWYVFFTSGLDIERKVPLIISRSGGAMIITGIVMMTICGCVHFMDGESFFNRAATCISWVVITTATTLFLLSISSEAKFTPVSTRGLTPDELTTLTGCEVSEGSTKVRCYLPGAAKREAAQ